MMNFSAFGGPFSGIHQFAAKFGHDTQSGPFSSANSMNTQDVHGNRYHTTNHFNQNSTSGNFNHSKNVLIRFRLGGFSQSIKINGDEVVPL